MLLLYPEWLTNAVVGKVLKCFTQVKVSVLLCRSTLLQVKVQNSTFTWVKVQKYWHQNVLKVPKVKVLIYAECPISSFQMYKTLLKIADLQAHNVTHCELVDRLFSNGRNVYRAEVVNVCFVIIIKIYKVTSN